MSKRITYILSNTDRAIVFEWIVKEMNKKQFILSFIHLNNETTHLHKWLLSKNIESYFIKHNGKKSYPLSIFKVIKLLYRINPNIVHTHLFDANLIGLFSAKVVRVPNRIYTRHHSTYHHDYFPNAVKYDKITNYLSTDIVAISKNVKSILEKIEKVPSKKISLIPHGFDLKKISSATEEEILSLKEKYKINNTLTVGIIARYIRWKGIEYTISAFKEILLEHPEAILIIANANGPYKKEIQRSLTSIPKKNYREIEYESNFAALYQLFDIFVHVPIDPYIEAYGQIYVEALAAGIPSIFTLSGIAKEFIINNENAMVVPFKSSEEIKKNILILVQNEKLRNKLINNGKKSIQQFNLNRFINQLETLYNK